MYQWGKRQKEADFAYDGATADDASLGIPLELAGYVNPENYS